MKKSLLTIVFLLAALFCAAQSGSITVTSVQQRSDGSGLVDVFFNLSGPSSFYFVNLRVSFDAGINYFPVGRYTFSGDVGPITPGSNKHIVWNPTHEHPNRYSPQTKLKLISYIIEEFNPCPGTPTLTDFDGNTYVTVQIGNQCWMASNLNTTRDANGNNITRYCYSNIVDNCEIYGGLYSWATVMNGAGSSGANPSGVQGICPTGWHVPSDAEWTQLTNYLIETYIDITSSNVGNKLKSCRQVSSPLGGDCNTSEHPRWNSNATHYGTNDFGFSALPGGYRYSDGSFSGLGSTGYWWSSTESSSTHAWYRRMISSNGEMSRYNLSSKTYSFSLRCLKD
ncbi:MAG TPA: hypothetical protein ENN08_03555 [Bacteroidales bacterium]|nr:hypothetical protein [Bacteroidales bacterium]